MDATSTTTSPAEFRQAWRHEALAWIRLASRQAADATRRSRRGESVRTTQGRLHSSTRPYPWRAPCPPRPGKQLTANAVACVLGVLMAVAVDEHLLRRPCASPSHGTRRAAAPGGGGAAHRLADAPHCEHAPHDDAPDDQHALRRQAGIATPGPERRHVPRVHPADARCDQHVLRNAYACKKRAPIIKRPLVKQAPTF